VNSVRRATFTLRMLDELLWAQPTRPLSLDPRREVPTSFEALGRFVAASVDDEAVLTAFDQALAEIVRAVLHHFPNNIFWDFDYLVASLLNQALASKNEIEFITAFHDDMILLLELFGRYSKIHFQYLHDFLYGFDWAKWVQKDPQTRQFTGPFSITYLGYTIDRGRQLLDLIAAGDRTYPRLPDGTYRNAFSFGRSRREGVSPYRRGRSARRPPGTTPSSTGVNRS
jgi:hypothetical protein